MRCASSILQFHHIAIKCAVVGDCDRTAHQVGNRLLRRTQLVHVHGIIALCAICHVDDPAGDGRSGRRMGVANRDDRAVVKSAAGQKAVAHDIAAARR